MAECARMNGGKKVWMTNERNGQMGEQMIDLCALMTEKNVETILKRRKHRYSGEEKKVESMSV